MPLSPPKNIAEAQAEETVPTMGATAPQTEAGSLNQSEDNVEMGFEEDNTIICPMKPRHVDFGKSKIKEGHIEVLNCFGYIDWVRLGGDELVPSPREDEIVVLQCFLKAALRFPLHKTVVAVLKRFKIYLYQLTPNAIVRLGIFIGAIRSQGIEYDAEAFYEAFNHIHELHFQTKATRGLHNNFGCYNFTYRRGSMFSVLAYRSKWPNKWAKEWFYMKKDLTVWADILGIIQYPIATNF
jgi:hypothetical protein